MSDLRIDPVSSPDELDVLRATMEGVWGPEIVPPRNLLRGLALGGACLLLARRNDRPIGFALGWLGWERGVHVHSHQVGVSAAERGGGVGLALKLAQRDQCLANGITEMRWTFDPMLWANARFNIVRLGAHVVEFLPHCYGDRRDAFNTGDRTDRVEVSWPLDQPVGGHEVEARPDDVVIAIPRDYQSLRSTDPHGAASVRASVGEAFADAFGRGLAIRGMNEQGYVVGSD
jgi:predicted GNAT superfamily acetyltransferase